MTYTIGQVAEQIGVATSTLRYYDKEGLLPFVGRTEAGTRVFTDADFGWLQMIGCLKKAGLPIKDIRRYIDMVEQGDETIGQRLEMFNRQREVIERQIQELRQTLSALEYKCWYYQTAQAEGTTKAVEGLSIEELPEQYRETAMRLKGKIRTEA